MTSVNAGAPPAAAGAARIAWLRRGLWLSAATVVWNVLEGLVAVVLGITAGSVALVGFGVDSFIETGSALVVGWGLARQLRGVSSGHAERVERLTARIAGGLLFGLALYVTVEAARQLLGLTARAGESRLGLALAAVSLLLMPLLGSLKLRAARALGSRALRADGYESIFCAWLSLTTLLGLGLNALLGWWWADPVAALVLVPFIAREGLESWGGDSCEENDGDD